MSERGKGCGRGCLIAAAVFAAIVLVCSGVLALLGYSIWKNPEVQRAVGITRAAFELSQEAMAAPGTAELRAAGCRQALVFTPELQKRFLATVEPDADAAFDDDFLPLVVCRMPNDGTEIPSCEQLVSAYVDALEEPPPEIAVTVDVLSEGTRCEGVYGTFLREFEPEMRGTFGRFSSPEPPPTAP